MKTRYLSRYLIGGCLLIPVFVAGGCGYGLGMGGEETPRASAESQSFFKQVNKRHKQRISLESSVAKYEPFYAALRVALSQRHTRIVPRKMARTHLRIHALNAEERVITRGRDAKNRDIMLILTLAYSWSRNVPGDRAKTFGPYSISVHSLYQHDDRRYLIDKNEQRKVRKDLERDLIGRLLRSLSVAVR